MKPCVLVPDQTTEYLAGVLDIELNLHIQKNTLKQLEKSYNSLARPRKFIKPQQEVASLGSEIVHGFETAAPICAILAGIVGLLFNDVGGFWGLITGAFMAVVYGLIGIVAGGVLIGTIVGLFFYRSANQKYAQAHQANLEKYGQDVCNDVVRVEAEKMKKKVLGEEIRALRSCYQDSLSRLDEIYEMQILAPEYRNLCAVSSLYGYFASGRTKSLAFNERTGDKGAYNLYEEERRMNLILTNMEEILVRLDDIVVTQQELAHGLKNANAKIHMLCTNVNSHMNRVSQSLSSIERCQGIVAYNSERTARELEFMNLMRVWGY